MPSVGNTPFFGVYVCRDVSWHNRVGHWPCGRKYVFCVRSGFGYLGEENSWEIDRLGMFVFVAFVWGYQISFVLRNYAFQQQQQHLLLLLLPSDGLRRKGNSGSHRRRAYSIIIDYLYFVWFMISFLCGETLEKCRWNRLWFGRYLFNFRVFCNEFLFVCAFSPLAWITLTGWEMETIFRQEWKHKRMLVIALSRSILRNDLKWTGMCLNVGFVAGLLCNDRLMNNPENTVGILTTAGQG